MPDFADRVAVQAREIRFLRVLLTLLAAPFFALGWIVGMIWVAVTWILAAAALGFEQAKGDEPTAGEG